MDSIRSTRERRGTAPEHVSAFHAPPSLTSDSIGREPWRIKGVNLGMESHNGAASLRASFIALKMKSTGRKLGKVGEARSYIKFDFLGSCFLGSSWEYYYIR